MRTKKNPPPSDQLELPFSSGLWERVDSLNDRTMRAHLARRKLVRPKLRQPKLFDTPDEQ